MNNIIYIPIKQLSEHPDNPRKDIGDVSDLANSIKESGILQNLTVVPYEGRYRIIIGHRRYNAAKLAGLTELPCVVADMDEKTQVATMLSENMQRTDLTVFEQSKGVQMLLDLGVDESEIMKKTGFSKKTVQNRAKLAQLPSDGFKAAEQRGATIAEMVKCMEIENPKKRELVLATAGTRDFDWKFRNVLNEQNYNKQIKPIRNLLRKKGVEKCTDDNARWNGKWTTLQQFSVIDESFEDFEKLLAEHSKEKKLFYHEWGTTVYLIKKAPKKETPKKSEKELEADRRRAKLKELTEKAFNLRREFMLLKVEPTETAIETAKEYLLEFALDCRSWYYTLDDSIVMTAVPIVGERLITKEHVQELLKKKNRWIVAAYFYSGDGKNMGFYAAGYGESNPTYRENSRLVRVYEFLKAFGYQISSEEEQLMNGTHELFEGVKNG